MAFLAPFIIPAITVASTVATTVAQIKAQKDQQKQQRAALLSESEELRKTQLLSDRQARVQQRRAAGSGQTLLTGGGVGSEAEIGRATLLGQ